jgi:hypothetical protein
LAQAETLLAEVAGPIELLLGDRLYSRNGEPLESSGGEKCCASCTPRYRGGET